MQIDLLQSLILLSGLITVYGAGIYMVMDILLFHFSIFSQKNVSQNNETSPTDRVGYNNTFFAKKSFSPKMDLLQSCFPGTI